MVLLHSISCLPVCELGTLVPLGTCGDNHDLFTVPSHVGLHGYLRGGFSLSSWSSSHYLDNIFYLDNFSKVRDVSSHVSQRNSFILTNMGQCSMIAQQISSTHCHHNFQLTKQLLYSQHNMFNCFGGTVSVCWPGLRILTWQACQLFFHWPHWTF